MTTKIDLLKAIRAKCIECSCGSKAEVRLCDRISCPLHTFRFGIDLDSKPKKEKNPTVVSDQGLGSGNSQKPMSEELSGPRVMPMSREA